MQILNKMRFDGVKMSMDLMIDWAVLPTIPVLELKWVMHQIILIVYESFNFGCEYSFVDKISFVNTFCPVC